jgi:hypothetical protein
MSHKSSTLMRNRPNGASPRLSAPRLAAADYIREMAREMADIAGGNRFPVVQWLFQMAYIEMHDIVRGARPADGRSSPPK